jgi:D-alanyl-D-alanine carboxypeptidase
MKRKTTQFLILLSMFSVISFYSCNKDNDDQINQSEIIENEMKAVLDSIIENTHVPGLVAGIWAPDEGINFVYTAGVSNLETGAPMSDDMIFRIGSNTKTFTITVLLQLVDEGLISLDDYLFDYMPLFPRADEVTIEMLTNMRSGIFNYTESDDFWIEMMTNPAKHWTADDLIEYSLTIPFYFDPGTSFHYSNTNTTIISKIIENLTGQTLEYNIRTRILDDLNFVNTAYLEGGAEIPGFHSSGYYAGEYDPELPDLSEFSDVSWAGAAGSMISDIYELRIYAEALANGYFLNADTHQKRIDCLTVSGTTMKYGQGIFDFNGFYGHNGGMPGYTSLMISSPTRNCTIIIWYNCQLEESDPTQLVNFIPKIIYPDL